jgi:hypothetical protein
VIVTISPRAIFHLQMAARSIIVSIVMISLDS